MPRTLSKLVLPALLLLGLFAAAPGGTAATGSPAWPSCATDPVRDGPTIRGIRCDDTIVRFGVRR